jgi:hypothetical protein
MKLDPRIVLPAAAVAAALAIPSSAAATPPVCPDHFSPTFTIVNPNGADKDHNGNLIVCHKDVPGQGDPTKDDHGFITSFIDDTDPNNWADDVTP